MKKLLAVAVALSFASPALACPNMDHDAAAPKTAEKAPADSKDKAKAEPKKDAKPGANDTKDTAKKTADKKPGDKVSLN